MFRKFFRINEENILRAQRERRGKRGAQSQNVSGSTEVKYQRETLPLHKMKRIGNISILSTIFIFNNEYRFLTNFHLILESIWC